MLRVLDDADDSDISRLRIEDLAIRRVSEAGEMLDVAYDLLTRQFKPSVLDSKDVYVDAVSDRSGSFRDFDPIFLAGVFQIYKDEWLAGFLSSDLMLFGNAQDKVHLTIGNVTTSLKIQRKLGIGTRLWQASLRAAEFEARRANRRLMYAVAEAEDESLGFWAKLGFKQPLGVEYYQPPLDFDDRGTPTYEVERETLVILPLQDNCLSIQRDDLKEIIQDIYWNWGLRPSVHRLSSAAMARAREYVMGQVLTRTIESFPSDDLIPLLDVQRQSRG
jgi:hypothetical protein